MLIVGLYILNPQVNSKINYIFMLFSSMSVESIIGYIRSFGPYAVAVSFFLMVFQSVAAPLPAFLITFANAAIWGWWRGAILSWSSAMAGAILCFMIARIAGRDVVEKLTTKFAMDSIEQYFERYGKHTILICRLLPFVSLICQLCSRTDIYEYGSVPDSNRNWPASCNYCIFLCWRNADRKCKKW